MWATEKIATSNIKFTLKDKAKRKIVNQALREGVSVLGTQEVRSIGNIFPGYWDSIEKNDATSAREIKISWDTNVWDHVDHIYVKASDSNVIPAATRWISILLLRHIATGIEVYFVNFHAVAHVDRGGRPGWTGRGRLQYLRRQGKPNPLVKVYDEGMDSVQDVLRKLKKTGKHIVFMGDVNVGAKADARVKHPLFVYRRLTKMNFKSIYMKLGYPTTSKRLIDQVWVLFRNFAKKKKKRVRILNYKILPRKVRGQDHKTVVVKLSWEG